jgi:hypothetical protein
MLLMKRYVHVHVCISITLVLLISKERESDRFDLRNFASSDRSRKREIFTCVYGKKYQMIMDNIAYSPSLSVSNIETIENDCVCACPLSLFLSFFLSFFEKERVEEIFLS